MFAVIGEFHYSILLLVVVLVSLNDLKINAFIAPTGSRIFNSDRSIVMAGGFGSAGAKGATPNKGSEKRNSENKISAGSSGSKTVTKGDGASFVKHCPSMDRKFRNIRCVHNDPPIFEIDDFLSPSICDEFIERAEKEGLVVPSQTFSADSGSKRTSSTWYLPYDAVPELLNGANKLTGLKIPTFEEPQVVRYEIGQQFSWHYDAIPKSLQDPSGNRLATIIVYLNDVKSGGATCFKDLDLQIKPAKGKALLFFPSFADGSADDRTMHAGQVAMDTKWIAQMWIHERDYTPRTPAGTTHEAGIAAVERLLLRQSPQS